MNLKDVFDDEYFIYLKIYIYSVSHREQEHLMPEILQTDSWFLETIVKLVINNLKIEPLY